MSFFPHKKMSAFIGWIRSLLNPNSSNSDEIKSKSTSGDAAEIGRLPVIDWTSCKVRISKSPRDERVRRQEQELLRLIKRQYYSMYHQEGKTVVPLKHLIPASFIKSVQPATHFIWTMSLQPGLSSGPAATFSIPFSFQHLSDPFPVADLRYLIKTRETETQVSLLWPDESKHTTLDRTAFFRPFLWNTFAPGYPPDDPAGFRPHAWTWLFTSFAKGDPECVLRLERGQQVWYMLLAEPASGPWISKPQAIDQ